MTAIPLCTLKTWLEEARRAYHQIMLGKASVKLMIEGELVEFNRVRASDLAAYIASLEAQVARSGAPAAAAGISVTL